MEWIKCIDRVPDTERNVLAVKQLKSGRLEVCIARCIPDYKHYDYVTKTHTVGPYWVCGGNNNIIAWMELPEIPAE